MDSETYRTRKVHLVSLGCARNRVDSEVMLGSLFEKGWKHTSVPKDADAIIVNTCGFIQSAKEESVDTILDLCCHKNNNSAQKLVVTGCLPQRYKKQLVKALPEVDLFIGTDEFARLPELIESKETNPSIHARRTNYLYNETLPRINTLHPQSAYVKVAEGCQHNCAFCIIPAIRGKLRSRPIASVVREVTRLADQGVIEINLIAQDLAAYGRDLGQDSLLPLLKELARIDGIRWIRLLYLYPENINKDFLQFMADEEKIVKYLDIPVQHASDQILAKMNRKVTRKILEERLAQVREYVPNIAVRTSVMVGFPSETEQDFMKLLSFIAETKFDHLGCFTYSQEEGTVAGRMSGQISENVKAKRQEILMKQQQQISKNQLKSFLGKEVEVLVSQGNSEGKHLWEGRASFQAPEVDGIVYVNAGNATIGKIHRVKVTETHDYDLVGQVVG